MSKKIEIIDTTLRDGHQSLWATRMTTGMMLPVTEAYGRAGFAEVDLVGTVQFDVCVRYLKEDPWERARLLRDRIPGTPLRALVRSRNIARFDPLPVDVVELWTERLYANGFRVIGAFDGLNDVDNIITTTRKAKSLGARVFGALSFSISPVHTDELYVRTATDLVKRGEVDAIMLKDASGLLTPERVSSLVPKLKTAIGDDIALEVHSHSMVGMAAPAYMAAVECGADQLHASIWPLAHGSAQPPVQDIVSGLGHLGYSTDVDLGAVEEISAHFMRVARAEGMPIGRPAPYDPFHYQHQIPGGMLSNLELQLADAGLAGRLDEVLEECVRLREELGWPIMITPFAQLVATQAVFNVVHGERFAVVPDEIKKYALGYYGKLPAPVDPDVLDRIVERGSSSIAQNPEEPSPALPRLRAEYPDASDDERLLRLMFSGSQVDAMLRLRQPIRPWSPGRPLRELLKGLADLPASSSVQIRKPGFVLDCRAGGHKPMTDGGPL